MYDSRLLMVPRDHQLCVVGWIVEGRGVVSSVHFAYHVTQWTFALSIAGLEHTLEAVPNENLSRPTEVYCLVKWIPTAEDEVTDIIVILYEVISILDAVVCLLKKGFLQCYPKCTEV
ncbi:hypothetical protein KSP40_PGU017033 [Platanthera guangdongensis]|uniref:Uncharacterized protein n=1 Tax=Platanthera guangdongensis TaxID=2320717 RepID=A0ABR2MW19_9ASPA